MASCIGVDSHIQIIFGITSFNDHIKITRLKLGIKFKLMLHVRTHSFIISWFFNSIWRRHICIWRRKLKFVMPLSVCKVLMYNMCICWSKTIKHNSRPDAKLIRLRLFELFVIKIEWDRRTILGLNVRSPTPFHIRFQRIT